MKKIVGIHGNIVFEPENMKKDKLRKLEDVLEEMYGSISILGVTPNSPLEIPRMVCQSANNHSQIQISCINGQLVVRFDENFYEDFDLCLSYCKERMNLLQKALLEIGVKIKYSGITTQFVCSGDLNAINNLKSKSFKIRESDEVFDVLGRVTYVKDETYYLNLTMNNLRNTPTDEVPTEEVGVSFEVNDRYVDNFPKEKSHDFKEALDELFKIQSDFAHNTIDKLLLEGVFVDG